MDALKKILDYLRNLMTDKFHGKLIISFECGKIVNLREERNIKPEEL